MKAKLVKESLDEKTFTNYNDWEESFSKDVRFKEKLNGTYAIKGEKEIVGVWNDLTDIGENFE
jgi:hypothetical protein